MESKHTLGPWVQSGASVMSETPLRFIAAIGAPSGRDDEDAANGTLIAAAPDLLSTLKLLHACLLGKAGEAFRDMHPDTWWEVEAAIAKAEGRS